MSVWTHVSGAIRVDNLRKIGYNSYKKVDFNEILGINNLETKSWQEIEELKKQGKIVAPCGSEGGLTFQFWENPDSSCMASDAIFFIGDLRSYDESDIENELIPWFKAVVTELNDIKRTGCSVRGAVISADCEEGKVYNVSIVGLDSKFAEHITSY